MINALLSADADSVCGAEWNARSAERTNRRNGYRHRPLDTRVGTVDVAVPKLRSGSCFPEWLLERRKRAEGRRYLGLEVLVRCRLTLTTDTDTNTNSTTEVTTDPLMQLPA